MTSDGQCLLCCFFCRLNRFVNNFDRVSGMIALYFGVNESQGIEEVKRFEMEEREKTKVDVL